VRKDESLQIHALLRLLKQHVERKHGISTEAFQEYEELDVKPEHVYKKKGEHQEAMVMLSNRIADELSKADGSSTDEEEKREPIAA
jgi:hypothetical protein